MSSNDDHRLSAAEPSEQPAPAPVDDPDVDDTPLEEQPYVVCPNCGQDGGLDGLGDVALSGTWMTQLHCPECGIEFAVQTEARADGE
jgi:predicted RNA-binding Zn-ribbon protein involved in translation (DUF1610 family)